MQSAGNICHWIAKEGSPRSVIRFMLHSRSLRLMKCQPEWLNQDRLCNSHLFYVERAKTMNWLGNCWYQQLCLPNTDRTDVLPVVVRQAMPVWQKFGHADCSKKFRWLNLLWSWAKHEIQVRPWPSAPRPLPSISLFHCLCESWIVMAFSPLLTTPAYSTILVVTDGWFEFLEQQKLYDLGRTPRCFFSGLLPRLKKIYLL